jgi:threonine dehydrogenase-like Zn-dependent dehydrogenase
MATTASRNIGGVRKLQSIKLPDKMLGAILPGNSSVEMREFTVPKPGHGELIVKTKSSTICGSDLRCVYYKHEGEGQEAYQTGTICGHEPSGIVERVGSGMKQFKVGDRVLYLHVLTQ